MRGETSTAPPRTARLGLPFGLQFSLAESLLVALYACVGVAAAKSGGLFAWLFAEATLVLAVAFIVAAVFTRRAARAFAIGFAIGFCAHGLCLVYFGASEFSPTAAQLPYSKIVSPVWVAMRPERFVSYSTGLEVAREDLQEDYVEPMFQTQLLAPDGSGVYLVERPPREDFMLVAHALGAAAAGYLMGKLAAVLYGRRETALAQPNASS